MEQNECAALCTRSVLHVCIGGACSHSWKFSLPNNMIMHVGQWGCDWSLVREHGGRIQCTCRDQWKLLKSISGCWMAREMAKFFQYTDRANRFEEFTKLHNVHVLFLQNNMKLPICIFIYIYEIVISVSYTDQNGLAKLHEKSSDKERNYSWYPVVGRIYRWKFCDFFKTYF